MKHQRCRLKSLIDADEAVEDAYELICPIGGNSFLVGGSCFSASLLGQARASCQTFASKRSRCTECQIWQLCECRCVRHLFQQVVHDIFSDLSGQTGVENLRNDLELLLKFIDLRLKLQRFLLLVLAGPLRWDLIAKLLLFVVCQVLFIFESILEPHNLLLRLKMIRVYVSQLATTLPFLRRFWSLRVNCLLVVLLLLCLLSFLWCSCFLIWRWLLLASWLFLVRCHFIKLLLLLALDFSLASCKLHASATVERWHLARWDHAVLLLGHWVSELLPLRLLWRLHPRHRHLDRLDLTQRRLPNGLPNVNLDVCIVERDGIWREAMAKIIPQRVLGIQGQVVRLICALPLRYLHGTWLILVDQDGLVEIVYTAILRWEQGSLFVHMSAALAGYSHVVSCIIHCGAIIALIYGICFHETSARWE